MYKTKLLFLIVMLLGFTVASCSDTPIDDKQQDIDIDDSTVDEEVESSDSVKWKPFQPIYLSDVEKTVNLQQTEFSVNFFKAAQKKMANENFVVSPYSVATALSMLANGAAGNTAVELQNTLLGDGATLNDLNDYNKRIASEITTLDNYTKFEIANGIFPDNNFTLVSQFVKNNENFYNASIIPVDFSNLAECKPILNKWVDDATHGLIKNMTVDTYTPLLIANAIYFKSSWEYAFKKEKTTDAPFYNFDHTVSTVKMMEGNNYNYNFDGEFAILSIPFGNDAFSMYVAYNYDDNENSLNGIENFLTKENIKKYISSGRGGTGTIKLPRFEVGISGVNINVLLQGVGIKDLFSDKADLPEIFADKVDLFKPAIFHDCVLKVDETGTEGAAKTEIILVSCDINSPRPEPKYFNIDHPFVFWIAEKSTGTLLFMGQVNKLENAQE